jgi:DHA3 family macrolide efflux protein-like MFS transporter
MSTVLERSSERAPAVFDHPASMRAFSTVWIGQTVSLLGSSMSGFALGVWIFLETGSAIGFALNLLLNMLPKALLSPFAGLLADRRDRRRIMMFADLGACLATVAAALLFASGKLLPWHVYLLTALDASASALQAPAFGAAVTQLVPKERFGRANGMLQLGEAIGQIAAPVLAGIVYAAYGLATILVIDMATFLVAFSTLLAIHFPRLQATGLESASADARWTAQLAQAVSYLRPRQGLVGLLVLFAMVNFFVGVAEALLTPMVLLFTTPEILGRIMTVGGLGMLIGSIAFTATGGGRRRIFAVFGGYAALGAAVILAGSGPSADLVAVAVFLAFLAVPTVMGASQTILQAKVAPEIQGRVFGLRMALNTLAFAIAYPLSGWLADTIFEPFMASGTRLAGSIGGLIGFGPGRGMGLLFVLTGILASVTALTALASPRIRRVEVELPDWTTDGGR